MPVIITKRHRGLNGDTNGVLGLCGSCNNNARLHGFAENEYGGICYDMNDEGLGGEALKRTHYGESHEILYNERDGCPYFWPYDERDIPTWKRALEMKVKNED
jgi:hypothetical protein